MPFELVKNSQSRHIIFFSRIDFCLIKASYFFQWRLICGRSSLSKSLRREVMTSDFVIESTIMIVKFTCINQLAQTFFERIHNNIRFPQESLRDIKHRTRGAIHIEPPALLN